MPPTVRRPGAAWPLLALLVFVAATSSVYGGVWREGPRETVPSAKLGTWARPIIEADQRFVVWVVARNARALCTNPLALFEAEQCYPARRALALGEPMVTMGLLGVPAALLSDDPVLIYNFVLAIMALLAAGAMYLLIADWTGSPAAGVVAGLLYAFHPIALQDPVHPYAFDTTWTVFAFFFARRLCSDGRWRDALGLCVSTLLQITTSFYPFVAALLLAAPFGIWLVFHSGRRGLPLSRIAAVVGAVGVGAAIFFAPYVELSGAGTLAERSKQHFAWWGAYLPGAKLFPGWPCVLLVFAAFALPRRLGLPGSIGDPRGPLLAGASLVAVATSGSAGPGPTQAGDAPALWNVFAALLPGFGTVRLPWIVAMGVHLAACVLAGIGAAGLLRLAHRLGRRTALLTTTALLATVSVETTRPGWLGLERPVPFEGLRIVPDAAARAFFDELEVRGNRGPIFEYPLGTGMPGAPSVFLSGYHRRPTSACYVSHQPAERSDLERIRSELPSRDAIRDLGQLGFTTIVFHRGGPGARGYEQRFQLFTRGPQPRLRVIHRTETMTAYEIDVPSP